VSPAPRVAGVTLELDAFTGAERVRGPVARDYDSWAISVPKLGASHLVPSPADPWNWEDNRIGWGVILPERLGLCAKQLATTDDAPEPIRALVAHRKGKVLRYRSGQSLADWVLRDYAGNGDLLNAGSPRGMGHRQMPMYLLICASPDEIPWEVQYELNPVRYVGRLDLDKDGLCNYVQALLTDDWAGSAARYDSPVVWSVDHGGGDISTLMRKVLGDPLFAQLRADTDMPHAKFLGGAARDATAENLVRALRDQTPALVVTTSHGMTGPLDDQVAMRENLGALVDQDDAVVSPASLLNEWQPDGAIWFAQACCSSGANQPSAYDGLFAPNGLVAEVLTAVAALGAVTSPLPRALLGAAKPLRAFIGRVEPTFDWTMSFPLNQQSLTDDLKSSLYDDICYGLPVGLAMSRHYQAIGSLLLGHDRELKKYNVAKGAAATDALDMALYSKVTALDRASTVILGDPTVAIPKPG
jgi:hypothetical protein